MAERTQRVAFTALLSAAVLIQCAALARAMCPCCVWHSVAQRPEGAESRHACCGAPETPAHDTGAGPSIRPARECDCVHATPPALAKSEGAEARQGPGAENAPESAPPGLNGDGALLEEQRLGRASHAPPGRPAPIYLSCCVSRC